MKKFRFGLETLLRHRRNTEEKERTTLSRIHLDLQNEAQRDAEIEQKRMQTLCEMAAIGAAESSQEDLALFYPYLDRLRYESEQTRRNMGRLEQELQAQRNSVIAAARDRKVIERLKTKQQRQFETELSRDEQKQMEEIAVMRLGHRSTP